MASTYTERTERTDRSILRAETTGSLVEIAGGVAIIVLSIIGLARIGTGVGALPEISAIILGAALIAEGGTIATEFTRLMSMSIGAAGAAEFTGGMTTEIVVGAVVLVLGVLSVLGVAPAILVPSAIIVAGALLLISAANVQRMNSVKVAALETADGGQALLQSAISTAAGFQVLAGIASVVLGILALSATAHVAVFALAGLLVLGAAVTMSGGTLSGSLMRIINRR
ncbi:MAG TPA: hypothetical protein VHX61_08995 [Rhizomicrobium sp.]|jgi:hypothetical protein|nr:hypothetical protein [Rhizomicrobium sp.]